MAKIRILPFLSGKNLRDAYVISRLAYYQPASEIYIQNFITIDRFHFLKVNVAH